MLQYVHSIFCEDIRQEVGDRYSLMGLLGYELTVPSPRFIPKLCVAVWVSSPSTEPYTSVRLRILLNDVALVDQVVEDGLSIPASRPDSEESRDTRILSSFNAVLSPFRIDGEGILKVRVSLDGGPELKGGALRLKIDPGHDALMAPADRGE
ncbi:MAG: hypothetical protein ACM31D_00780 [Bacteroidota bacterium]